MLYCICFMTDLQSSMFTFNVAEGQQSLYLQALEQRCNDFIIYTKMLTEPYQY